MLNLRRFYDPRLFESARVRIGYVIGSLTYAYFVGLHAIKATREGNPEVAAVAAEGCVSILHFVGLLH